MLTFVVVGKTLAYTSINFHNEKKELVARGSHTKYVFSAYDDNKMLTNGNTDTSPWPGRTRTTLLRSCHPSPRSLHRDTRRLGMLGEHIRYRSTILKII